MPVAMTFNSLQDDLRAYLERGFVADTTVYDQLPSLINLAERDIATKLKVLGFLNVVTSVLAAGVSTYVKPDRWRETASINVTIGGRRRSLYPRSYEYCRMYWPDDSEQEEPLFYADYDYSHWLIAPTPDAAYDMEVNFWEQPPLLDSTNQTNWLTDYAPNALLHGALLQCAPFLKEDERVPMWQTLYEQDLAALDGQDLQRIIDRTSVRREV